MKNSPCIALFQSPSHSVCPSLGGKARPGGREEARDRARRLHSWPRRTEELQAELQAAREKRAKELKRGPGARAFRALSVIDGSLLRWRPLFKVCGAQSLSNGLQWLRRSNERRKLHRCSPQSFHVMSCHFNGLKFTDIHFHRWFVTAPRWARKMSWLRKLNVSERKPKQPLRRTMLLGTST